MQPLKGTYTGPDDGMEVEETGKPKPTPNPNLPTKRDESQWYDVIAFVIRWAMWSVVMLGFILLSGYPWPLCFVIGAVCALLGEISERLQ